MNSTITLDHFDQRSDLIHLLNDAKNSNLYIIYLHYRDGIKKKMVKSPQANQYPIKSIIRLAKVNAIAKYTYGWLKEKKVELLPMGPVLEEQYPALNILHNQGLIRIEKVISDEMFRYQFKITEDGVKFIEEKLRSININTDLSISVPFEDEIINLLKLENEELVRIATECFGNDNNDFKVNNIGEFKIIQIFDWKEFGDGNWKNCYDSLLWSLQSMDDYGRFRERDTNLYGFNYQNVAQTYYFKPKNGETLRSVFQKSMPPSINENKIEAKNYIINLWYILEAVNIFHAIVGICPCVEDIARMCLLTYKLEVAKSYKRKDFDKLRRLRESTLRKDIDKLKDAGLIKIVAKDSKKYLYRISGFEFAHDDQRFKLCNHDLIHKKYILRKERELLQSIPIIKNSQENFIEADFH
jgi:DNA-binding PadR family transcriptional regulator